MKVFLAAILVAVVLAAGGGFVLKAIQKPTGHAVASDSVRLDHGEGVDFYGRQPS